MRCDELRGERELMGVSSFIMNSRHGTGTLSLYLTHTLIARREGLSPREGGREAPGIMAGVLHIFIFLLRVAYPIQFHSIIVQFSSSTQYINQ
jgi:hypothetical protein